MDQQRATDLLLTRRASLATELDRVEGDLRTVRAAKADGTDDDEHDPEGATTSAQWSHATGMRSVVVGQLEEVDAALSRLADGTYGVCARCGKPVGDTRLEARPTAALCIDCARETPGLRR